MALRLNIANDFSPVPVGRYRTDGDKSGEAFRDDILYPKIRAAKEKQTILEVDFTGMYGLSSSFLEEAFGGLVREKGLNPDEILRMLKFLPEKSYFDLYIKLTKKYINDAKPTEPEAEHFA